MREKGRQTERERQRYAQTHAHRSHGKMKARGSEGYFDKPRNTETGKENEEILPAFSRTPFLFCKMRGLLWVSRARVPGVEVRGRSLTGTYEALGLCPATSLPPNKLHVLPHYPCALASSELTGSTGSLNEQG